MGSINGQLQLQPPQIPFQPLLPVRRQGRERLLHGSVPGNPDDPRAPIATGWGAREGAVFFDIHASEPWVAATPPGQAVVGKIFPGADHLIPYHVLTTGTCWGSVDGEPPAHLSGGDIIVFAEPLAVSPAERRGAAVFDVHG